jgi:hypothetical protein
MEIKEKYTLYNGQVDELGQKCGFGRQLVIRGDVTGQIWEGSW